MSDGHCFISYSNAKTEQEAVQFAIKLADKLKGEPPHIDIWVDNRSIQAGNWDEQVSNAIKSCKCLLFVASPDSVMENSICADEVNWALKYKKVVIPLIVYKDVEVPFRLSRRKFVDFTGDFGVALSQLRNLIAWLDSPDGVLESMKDRLADAQRDLRRFPENAQRIESEIDELTEQIKRQEEVVRNPKAAEEKTEKNIQSGLERERKPVKEVISKQLSKFINPPPGLAPNYFQDRTIETKQIVDFLNNDSQRLMTIVGRAGVGKTAMVCRLLKALERGELPDDLGEMKADGIVYLSETGSHRVNFANVFADLIKLLPPSEDTAERLEGIYKNPQTSTGDKMRALLDAFPSGRVILLLDNFETLIDPESLSLRDSELSEALNALLGGQHHAVKAVITTRIAPRDLAMGEPGRQHHLSLDEGLESPYAENVLREMDADGRVGLKSAPDALLNKAREKTRGYPRALEALYAILSVDRYTTLEELLEISLPDEVVQKLVGEAFNRLDPSAQKVMQALAVYNRPVSPAAIDYLLQPHLPSIDSAPILQRLANMHFVRMESKRFYLHRVDREFAFGLLTQGDEITIDNSVQAQRLRIFGLQPRRKKRSDFTQIGLTDSAASYFAQARKARTDWKKLDDLAAQLAEFDLRYAAGDYDTACSILSEFDIDYLDLWGHYRLMILLHEKLQGKINDTMLSIGSMLNLGGAYLKIGQTKIAIEHFELGFKRSQEAKSRLQEGAALGNLGIAYSDLGDVRKAIEFYKDALVISREKGTKDGESACLINLGSAYSKLDDARKAVECYELALIIDRKTSDRNGESIALENMGHACLSSGEDQQARGNYQQAIQIADEISSPMVQLNARWGLAQTYLFKNDLVNALAIIEAALQYDMPRNNHNATTLHGVIALRQGERETAQEAFTKSIAQADEILAKTPDYYSALDAKGLALCGNAVSREWRVENSKERDEIVAEAVETFRKARKIAPHAGVVKSVLRLFDELVKCDEEGVLKGVREVIEGN